ncbi:hypothetical protein HDV01_003309 [Terramyces sp. JEL0728]|nr:hypothetical protein HDV01_003309 [Terramyces sp. JEL0728]
MKRTFQSRFNKKLKRSNICPVCAFDFIGSFIEFEVHVDECLSRKEDLVPDDLIAIEDDSTAHTLVEQEMEEMIEQELEATVELWDEDVENKQGNETTEKAVVGTKKGKPKRQYKCPWYKHIPDTNFTMDAFNYGVIENCSIYFLSHFHSDHYGGLTLKFEGKIYCSEVTAELVKMQLKVRPDLITVLPLNKRIEVEGHHVTLFDANHCPGAAIFLFEINVESTIKRILHTGDFRACPAMWNRTELKTRIDACYLDTTYCNPTYVFPSQSDVLDMLTDIVKKVNSQATIQSIVARNSILNYFKPKMPRKSKCLFVVGTYLIGKEKVIKTVSKAINSKIYVDARKLAIYKCQKDDYLLENLTTDPSKSDVHVTSMMSLDKKNLEALLEKNKKYTNILAIRPTGWTFSKKKDFSIHSLQIKKISPNIDLLPIPYSEHSSYSELKEFIGQLDILKIVPTVNVAKAKEMVAMLAGVRD